MENQFIRTQLLLGEAGMQRLAKARVAVFGIGGVGGDLDVGPDLAAHLDCHLHSGGHGLALVIGGPGLLTGHAAL